MAKPGDDDEQAIDRLTLYMLKETYCAAAGALMRMNPQAAEALFQAFERQIDRSSGSMPGRMRAGPAGRRWTRPSRGSKRRGRLHPARS